MLESTHRETNGSEEIQEESRQDTRSGSMQDVRMDAWRETIEDFRRNSTNLEETTHLNLERPRNDWGDRWESMQYSEPTQHAGYKPYSRMWAGPHNECNNYGEKAYAILTPKPRQDYRRRAQPSGQQQDWEHLHSYVSGQGSVSQTPPTVHSLVI